MGSWETGHIKRLKKEDQDIKFLRNNFLEKNFLGKKPEENRDDIGLLSRKCSTGVRMISIEARNDCFDSFFEFFRRLVSSIFLKYKLIIL